MSDYLYKTVPMRRTLAPKRRRGQSAEEAIADAVGALLEDHAQEGWEFYRSDVFVAPAKVGWLSRERNAEFNILTFRKARDAAALSEDDSAWRAPPADYQYSDPYVDPALRRSAAAAAASGAGAGGAPGSAPGLAQGVALRRRAPYPPSAGYDAEPASTPEAPTSAPPTPETRRAALEPRRGAPKPRAAASQKTAPPQTPVSPIPGEHARTADKLRRRARAAREQSPPAPEAEAAAPKVARPVIDDTLSLSASMRMRSDRD